MTLLSVPGFYAKSFLTGLAVSLYTRIVTVYEHSKRPTSISPH